MTDIQKAQIKTLRAGGMGYRKIAAELGISENTVKSFCKRNGLRDASAISTVDIPKEKAEILCKQCGKPVPQNEKRKTKLFCSDKCRMAWWNSHRELVNHKNEMHIECPHCGKKFVVAKSSKRKYCSHACYIAHRFGGENEER